MTKKFRDTIHFRQDLCLWFKVKRSHFSPTFFFFLASFLGGCPLVVPKWAAGYKELESGERKRTQLSDSLTLQKKNKGKS